MVLAAPAPDSRLNPTEEIPMTIAQTATCPSVFDAGLPIIAYDHLTDPDEAHRIIDDARELSPIAIGPHGPEVLSYELVRTVLRDSRFVTAQRPRTRPAGHHFRPAVGQGDHQYPGLDGDVHHRLRRLVSKAFAPRGAPTAAHARPSRSSTAWSTRSPAVGPLRRRLRHRPSLPHASHLRAAGRAAEDWQLFSDWTDDIKKIFDWNVAERRPGDPRRVGSTSTPTSRN